MLVTLLFAAPYHSPLHAIVTPSKRRVSTYIARIISYQRATRYNSNAAADVLAMCRDIVVTLTFSLNARMARGAVISGVAS